MKSMIATMILLVAMVASLTVNFFFINQVTDRMEEMISALPEIGTEECVAAAHKIRRYLESKENLISLSVGYETLECACEQTVLLISCSEANDVYGFQNARALLLDAIKDIRRAEQFSIGNLF